MSEVMIDSLRILGIRQGMNNAASAAQKVRDALPAVAEHAAVPPRVIGETGYKDLTAAAENIARRISDHADSLGRDLGDIIGRVEHAGRAFTSFADAVEANDSDSATSVISSYTAYGTGVGR